MEDEGEDVVANGVLDVEADVKLEEEVMPGMVVAREEDVDVDDWMVPGAVVAEEVVGWIEVSGVDVVDRLLLLEVTIVADGVEEDTDEKLAEVIGMGAVDDSTDRPADDGAADAVIVVCKAL